MSTLSHLCPSLLALLTPKHISDKACLPSLTSQLHIRPWSIFSSEGRTHSGSANLPNPALALNRVLEQNTIHTKAHNCPGRAWAILWNPWYSLPNVASIQHSQVLTHLWNGWMLARQSYGQPETQVGISNGSSASLVFETIEAIIDCSPEPQHQAVSPWYALDLTSPDFPLQFMI